MRANHVSAAVRSEARSSTRTIVVNQNFPNPSQPITHRALDLGTGWSPKPVALLLNGHRYEVKELNDGWRNPKKPHAMKVPILNDGNYGATVVLADGKKVPVILHVYTSFFR